MPSNDQIQQPGPKTFSAQSAPTPWARLIRANFAPGLAKNHAGLAQSVQEFMGFDDNKTYGQGILVAIAGVLIDEQHANLRGRVLRPPKSRKTKALSKSEELLRKQLGTITASQICSSQLDGLAGLAAKATVTCLPHALDFSPEEFKQQLDACLRQNMRVLVLPMKTYQARAEIADILNRLPDSVVVLAAAGDEGLCIDAFPASLERVYSVASCNRNEQRLQDSNLSPVTELLCPGLNSSALANNEMGLAEGSAVSLGLAAGAIAAILSLDRSLDYRELRTLIRGAPGIQSTPNFYQRFEAVIPRGNYLQSVLSGHFGQISLRNLTVAPLIACPGQAVQVAATVENTGRKRISGELVISLGKVSQYLPFTKLRPGHSLDLACSFAPVNNLLKTEAPEVKQPKNLQFIHVLPRGFPGCERWKPGIQLKFAVQPSHRTWIFLRDLKLENEAWFFEFWNGGQQRQATKLFLYCDGELVWQRLETHWLCNEIRRLKIPLKCQHLGLVHTWNLVIENGDSLEFRLP